MTKRNPHTLPFYEREAFMRWTGALVLGFGPLALGYGLNWLRAALGL